MRKLAIWAIMTFGRYAVVPVVALVLVAAGYVANWAMTSPGVLSLSLAVVLIVASMACLAITIGVLFAGANAKPERTLSRGQAPGLWRLWDKFAKGRTWRQLGVDGDLNASISETRLLAGIVGRRHTMTLGLPLLILLDQEAVEAIVAHEVAHASLMHTSGTVNLVEFSNVFDALFAYADPDETVMGGLAHFALAGLWRSLNSELQRRSRQCEFEADAMAAEWTSRSASARALALVAGNVGRVGVDVYQRCEVEMLGAMSIPKSPIMRIHEDRDDLVSLPAIRDHAMEAYGAEEDPNSSHPGLRERLRNLGLDALPDLTCGPSAAASMLAPGELERVLSDLDRDWSRLADARLEGRTLVHY